MKKQHIIILVLALCLLGSFMLQRPKKPAALKLVDLKTVFVIVEPGTILGPDGKWPDPLPVVFQEFTYPWRDKVAKGDGIITYSSEDLVPPGSTYCHMTVAQLFKLTLEGEESNGIVVNPGTDPSKMLSFSDAQISVVAATLEAKAELPPAIKTK